MEDKAIIERSSELEEDPSFQMLGFWPMHRWRTSGAASPTHRGRTAAAREHRAGCEGNVTRVADERGRSHRTLLDISYAPISILPSGTPLSS
jgi:hypothetical protein